jgi:flagellar hook assembly protein FlgD
VFTLTGSKVPDNMKIQIFSATGKIVREITKDELGPLHIGKNITEYAWDGKDQMGDLLANGVYFYTVIIKDQGKDVIKLGSFDFDKYFKKGFSKMVIIR